MTGKSFVHPAGTQQEPNPRLKISHEMLTAGYALNPTVWMCWGDEDFIGRIARTSRHQQSNLSLENHPNEFDLVPPALA